MEGLRSDAPGPAPGPPASESTGAAAFAGAPSPYTRADLYDLLFQDYAHDLDFYLGLARVANGPSLDVGCGTGRVLLRALETGVDIDGLDESAEMLERLAARAAERGLSPRVARADMRGFRMPRRYACVMIPFNAFAHVLAHDDQIAALRACHEHLLPGGRLTFDLFSATVEMLATPVTEPVLELETKNSSTGLGLRLYDGRRLDVATQTQHSQITIEELDAEGRIAHVHRFVTVVRWTWPSEMDLLLRLAGFARHEIAGGFDGRPVAEHQGLIVVSAWRDA